MDMDTREYLPISAVAEVLFCPRNFFYRAVEGAEETNHHMLEGRFQDERRNERRTRSEDGRVQTRQVSLSSDALGLRGVLDVLEAAEGELYPVEFKKGRAEHRLNDDVQVCLQGLLLEEATGRDVAYGYVYYVASAERRQVFLDESLRETALQALAAARAIREAGEPPPLAAVPEAKCQGCALAERCMPEESAFLTGAQAAPRRPTPGSNLGRTLYLDVPGAALRKRQGRLIIEADGQTLKDVPLSAVDQVVISQAASLSSAALSALSDLGIPLYLMGHGRVRSWLQPSWNKNVPLRRAQYRFVESDTQSLAVAREIVRGKILNQRTFLQRGNRERKIDRIQGVVERLDGLAAAAKEAEDKDSLRGLEGLAGRLYFSGFAQLLRAGEGFDFASRNRRPPRDPVNALLSYAYSLLTKDCINAIIRAGLDPYLGLYHCERYGRPALALDLMEEFRAIVADSVVLNVINRGIIKADEFEPVFDGIQLKDGGRKRFFGAYQTRIREEAVHPVFGYRVNYLRLMEIQARYLGKVMQGEWLTYEAFRAR
ncbi:CRISPR-associated endonuclease Cas1 [Heliobacterium gestii]|uniref:CRISPR-associated endonuclease Cas1 n=2 Tax=Heliomicrobium gestii TaxID=2699 RepID=A0A845L5X6_HELGE|nr:CRISPR-associated protein Cas1 [Heliomicrobium gestii]MZP42047.1 CRISPR-associated endonuclease Cas1 [Heliomicrobium gestii]